MTLNDFDANAARQAVNLALQALTKAFQGAHGGTSHGWHKAISTQVFTNVPLTAQPFFLFCQNATNRSGGARVADWNALAGVFCGWDPAAFAATFPLSGGIPDPALVKAVRAANGNRWGEGWKRLLIAAQHGAGLLAAAPVAQAVGWHAKLVAICGFDLDAIPLSKLSVADLWRASTPLVKIPQIGRELALNFFEGCRLGECNETGHLAASDSWARVQPR